MQSESFFWVVQLPGGAIRFREDEIDAWLEKRATPERGVVSHPAGRRPPRTLAIRRATPNEEEEDEMPAIQRGQAYRLGANRWGLRYYDADGKRRRKSPFPSQVRGARPLPRRDRARAARRAAPLPS